MSESRTPPGRLPENVVHFARVLRGAGLAVGPARVLDALEALAIAGVERREDWHATLSCLFLDRREQQAVFDQAFHIFWRDPALLERIMQLLLPKVAGRKPPPEEQPLQRVAEAFSAKEEVKEREQPQTELEIDAQLTFSAQERLQTTDFEQMTGAELAEAKSLIARMRLDLASIPTRRFRPDADGARVDLRSSLRASARAGYEWIPLRRVSRRDRTPPLVVLCDISGSMQRYTRIFLHFMHALSNDRDRVNTLVFGTRLTNITRHLRHRDVDVAVSETARAVPDWAGGTRIGPCLREFNVRWSRRLLGQNAVVLLLSDGLERDDAGELAFEVQRLHRSCRELIWLNPLLRYDGFEPRPAGIRAMLPHVDRFLPVHNLTSLRELAGALGGLSPGRDRAVATTKHSNTGYAPSWN